MRVSYSPVYYAHINEGHIFPMRKFEGLHRYLTENGIIKESNVVPPGLADWPELIQVHTPRYVDAILNGKLEKKEARRLGLPWTPSLATRSRLAVRGTFNAALMALEDGISGNLAGGTHHAMPDGGEGFCVFNDVAVAIKSLKRAFWVNKVLVIDCDVHQGNGTAHIFKDDPDVFTFSIHAARNYPFVKPPSDLDIGLDDQTGDGQYIQTLGDALDAIFAKFRPDIIFYLGGIDVLHDDHFGRLAITRTGLREREHLVLETAKSRNIPTVLLLSGGYAPTLRKTVEAHAQMFIAARDVHRF